MRRLMLCAALTVVSACSGAADDGSLVSDPETPTAAVESAPTPVPATVITETFDAPSSDLSEQELPWRVVEGGWITTDGTLALSEPAGAFPSLVVTGTGGPDGIVSVTMPQVANNAGLVFRYQDRSNYWAILAARDFVTWNLIKVIDGEPERIANTGESSVENFTVVGVRLAGPRIDVTVNGRSRLRIDDDTLADATIAGLSAGGPTSLDARWDDFHAVGIEAIPGPDAAPAPEPPARRRRFRPWSFRPWAWTPTSTPPTRTTPRGPGA